MPSGVNTTVCAPGSVARSLPLAVSQNFVR